MLIRSPRSCRNSSARQADQLASLEPDRAAHRRRSPAAAHQRHRERRLAAPRLADQAEDLALGHGQRYVAHRGHRSLIGREADVDVLEGQQVAHSLTPLRVEPRAQPVAEEVEREHGDRDREAGEDLDPRRLGQHVAPVGEHRARATSVGGCTPRPEERQRRLDLSANPIRIVACTIAGPIALGSTWRAMIRPRRVPRARAASMYVCETTTSVELRTTRARIGM